MLQRCHPSVLIRWCLFFLLAGFAWAIGLSAVNVSQPAQNRESLLPGSLLKLGAHSNISSDRLDASSQLHPATLKSKLRGWDNITAAEPLGIPRRHKPQHYKRRKLNMCANSDISISQGPDGSHGIPQFVVQIVNTCLSDGCTDRDLSISQSRDTSGGVPQFIVQIYNTCINNCEPSDVHVNCGWFASQAVVNPSVFRRVAFDDCLVNSGNPIPNNQILSFTYQNSFMYSLSFKSARFC